MTSKKSSANKLSKSYDLKRSFKTLIFPAVVSFLVASNIFVLKILNQIACYIERGANGKVDLDKTFLFMARDYSVMMTHTTWFGNVIDTACAIMVGVLFAFCAFLFLMRKNMVNMYLSSPLDRRALFSNRVTASCILMAVSCGIPILVDVIINIVIFGNPLYMLWHGLLLFAEYFLYMLVGFSLMSISMLACNTIIEALFFGAGELWLPTIIISLFEALACVFLRGYSNNSSILSLYSGSSSFKVNVLSRFSILNPLLFGKAIGNYYVGYNMLGFLCRANERISDDNLQTYSYLTSATIGKGYKWAQLDIIAPIIIWAVLCVGFLFIAKKLFLNRKAENAGIHSTSKVASRIFALEVSTVAFILAFVFLFEGIEIDKLVAFFISLIVFIIVYCIVMVISRRKIKLDKSTLRPVIASTAGVVAITLILATGGLGFTKYVPDVEDVSLAVIQTNIGTITGDESTDYSSTDNLSSISDSFERNFIGSYCVCTEQEDIQKLIDVAKLVNKKTNNMTGTTVRVMYVLKNGNKIERYFDTTDYDYCFKALSLTDTDAYKNELKNLMLDEKANDTLDKIIQNEKYDFLNYIGLFGNCTEREINGIFNTGKAKLILNDTMSEVEIKNTLELRKAIYDDKMSIDYISRFRPEGKPLGEIIFYSESMSITYQDGEDVYYDDDFPAKTIKFYIDDSMKNTVSYLKSTGEYDAIAKSATPDIKEVYYTSCSDYMNYMFKKTGYDFSNVHYIFNSMYLNNDVENNFADEDDYYSSYVNQLSKKPEKIEDKQKTIELWDKSRNFAYASPDDYIAVFVLEDGTEIQRLIYSDKL